MSHFIFVSIIFLTSLIIFNKYKQIWHILFLALIIRVLWIMLDYANILSFFDTSDATGFERVAWGISQNGLENVVSHFEFIGVGFFVSLISFLYLFIDRGFHIISLISIPPALLSIGILWSTVLRYSDRRTARIAAYFASFYPMMVMYSSQLLREVWIYLFIILSISLILKWRYSPSMRGLLKVFLSMLILMLFHEGFAGALLMFLLYSLWMSIKKRPSILNFVLGLVAISSIFILFYIYGLGKLGNSVTEAVSYENIKSIMENRMIGGASYNDSINASSLIALSLPILERVYLFFSSPLPWMIRGFQDIIVFVDAMIYVFFIFRIFTLSRFLSSSSPFILPFILFIPSVVAFSIGTGNFGTAMRHRVKFSPLILVTYLLLRFEKLRRGKYKYK
jgi:hypothetical protein